MALTGARELLTTRYGPAPGYVWVAGIAGVTFLVVRHRRASSTSADAASSSTQPGSGETPAPFDYGPGADEAAAFLPPGMPAPVANPAPVAPAPVPVRLSGPTGATSRHHRVYQVKRGDTIAGIARRFHTTVAAISKANPAIHKTRTGRISVGEVLMIP